MIHHRVMARISSVLMWVVALPRKRSISARPCRRALATFPHPPSKSNDLPPFKRMIPIVPSVLQSGEEHLRFSTQQRNAAQLGRVGVDHDDLIVIFEPDDPTGGNGRREGVLAGRESGDQVWPADAPELEDP